ncbi:MAG: flavin reductase family protein [candidate division KSB1 bacterium]|nr:flavin reductase family protein [candidate division KSB1 bacterium]MDZ7272706.1 flavin reductase family protein [candidate division KSB1 bacterium]MDZ7284271.1 flavin reductase family protein [candidate division KSB1 bacterium]MDZ7297333.1 flavin reductase family protein [candidate division KSB1 bacterium]MDZ7307042.1 flavin reductase family protein [candidate division KSB1 bacterium]
MSQEFVSFSTNAMPPREAARLFLSLVAPRPIAWVSTLSASGVRNLAPFSFFNAVANHPPTVMIAIGQRQGRPKDTLRNVQETGEFVINLVDEHLAAAMNLTSGEWEAGVDEFQLANLAAAPSLEVKPPRVADAPVAMEARLTQIVPVAGTSATLVLGRIVRFHMRAALLRPNGLVDAAALRPITRLGGEEYATIGSVFAMARPEINK